MESSTIGAGRSGRPGRARRSPGRWLAGAPGRSAASSSTSWPVWLGLSAVFLVGLIDTRRPLSMRTVDLLALLSFGASLAFFNQGEVFTSAALAVPPLAYLLARTAWIGFRGHSRSAISHARWPVWLLAGATLFLVGFRLGLNVKEEHRVIDVGYAGVIGADRILDGRAPYGAMPVTDDLPTCGRANADGEIRERIQSNGRCESANPRGDTYGPVGLSRLCAGGCGTRLERQVGRAAGCARDLDRVRPARPARARARRPSLRWRPARRDPCVRLGGVSVHDVRARREHE